MLRQLFSLGFGLLACVMALSWSPDAKAYAWMIRHDYAACAQCHADPSGGSLLTAYGRAQSELLLRTQYKKGAEEDPGRVGEFLFGAVTLPESLLLGGAFRSLYIRTQPSQGSARSRYIIMQADLVGQVTVDRFRANASIGYIHEGALGASITRDVNDRLISRHHWLGVDLGEDKQFLLRAGRMNLPFGIRSIEHTLWVRSETRTNINDAQQHGVALSFNTEKIRTEVMAIAGNFQLRPDDFRERGYSAYFEYAPIERGAFGVSSLVTHAEADLSNPATPVFRHAHGLFGRYAPIKPLVLMIEGDYLLRSPKIGQNASGMAGFFQADYEVVQGVHVIGTGELMNRSLSNMGTSYGLWGSAQWFFLPHVDVRADAIWQTLAVAPGAPRVEGFTLLGQFHAFL